MMPLKEVVYVPSVPEHVRAILVSDIGGTNSNFGIFQLIDSKYQLLVSLHAKSKEVTNFADLIAEVLAYIKDKYNIEIKRACLAAAGPISQDRTFVKPTNLTVALDTKEICKKANLDCAFLVNDFEVIGYGIERLDPKNLVAVNAGQPQKYAHKAIIGAGTGLGKCIMFYNAPIGHYVPIASEGGHADFAPLHQRELDLTKYIQKYENWTCNISWEDLLSGNGIQRIYHFLRHSDEKQKVNKQTSVHGPRPDEIFKNRLLDHYCWETFEWYTTFYARCAKNFALDSLALGGIYICGGIAAKNLELFQLPAFKNEFFNCGKQAELIKQIPIYVITDYNVSLYGAAEYMMLEGLC
jgi:glucokinase